MSDNKNICNTNSVKIRLPDFDNNNYIPLKKISLIKIIQKIKESLVETIFNDDLYIIDLFDNPFTPAEKANYMLLKWQKTAQNLY